MSAAIQQLRPGSTGDLALRHLMAFGPTRGPALAAALDKPDDELGQMLAVPVRMGLIAQGDVDGVPLYRVGNGIPLPQPAAPAEVKPPAPAPAKRKAEPPAAARATRLPSPPSPVKATVSDGYRAPVRAALASAAPAPASASKVAANADRLELSAKDVLGSPPLPPEVVSQLSKAGQATVQRPDKLGPPATPAPALAAAAAPMPVPARPPPREEPLTIPRFIGHPSARLVEDTRNILNEAVAGAGVYIDRLRPSAARSGLAEARELISATLPLLEVQQFDCARFESGRLVLELDGVVFVLPRSHARRLYSHLDGHDLERP